MFNYVCPLNFSLNDTNISEQAVTLLTSSDRVGDLVKISGPTRILLRFLVGFLSHLMFIHPVTPAWVKTHLSNTSLIHVFYPLLLFWQIVWLQSFTFVFVIIPLFTHLKLSKLNAEHLLFVVFYTDYWLEATSVISINNRWFIFFASDGFISQIRWIRHTFDKIDSVQRITDFISPQHMSINRLYMCSTHNAND